MRDRVWKKRLRFHTATDEHATQAFEDNNQVLETFERNYLPPWDIKFPNRIDLSVFVQESNIFLPIPWSRKI